MNYDEDYFIPDQGKLFIRCIINIITQWTRMKNIILT